MSTTATTPSPTTNKWKIVVIWYCVRRWNPISSYELIHCCRPPYSVVARHILFVNVRLSLSLFDSLVETSRRRNNLRAHWRRHSGLQISNSVRVWPVTITCSTFWLISYFKYSAQHSIHRSPPVHILLSFRRLLLRFFVCFFMYCCVAHTIDSY